MPGVRGKRGSLTDCLHLPADLPRLVASPAGRAGNLLDLRDASAFAAGHLLQAASLPLESALVAAGPRFAAVLESGLPSIFLPPRHEPLAVILTDAERARAVAAALAGRGRDDVTAVAWPPDAVVPPAAGTTGASSRVLWRPPEFLARWAHLLPPPAAGPVLDLGCGSGRAAVWLAERGHRVTGVDHQPDALALAERLAASRGVTVDLIEADLRETTAWPTGPWAAVVCIRYLHRELLRALPTLLQPEGVVVVRTFRDAGGYIGNPQPQHRLRAGELLALLPEPTFAHLVHAEDFDADGRPAAGLVAVCRGDAGRGGLI